MDWNFVDNHGKILVKIRGRFLNILFTPLRSTTFAIDAYLVKIFFFSYWSLVREGQQALAFNWTGGNPKFIAGTFDYLSFLYPTRYRILSKIGRQIKAINVLFLLNARNSFLKNIK